MKPRRFRGRRGFTRQPENSKRAHFRGPALQKHHRNSRKGPPRERRKNENCGGREKKERNFGGPAEGCPEEGGPEEKRAVQSGRGRSGRGGENAQTQHTTTHNNTHNTKHMQNTTTHNNTHTTNTTPMSFSVPNSVFYPDVVFFVLSSVFILSHCFFFSVCVFFVPTSVCLFCPVSVFFCPVAFFFVPLPSWGGAHHHGSLSGTVLDQTLISQRSSSHGKRGWQHEAASRVDQFRDEDLFVRMTNSGQALVRSQGGPGAGLTLATCPTCRITRMERSLCKGWDLALETDRSDLSGGRGRATNVMVRDLDLAEPTLPTLGGWKLSLMVCLCSRGPVGHRHHDCEHTPCQRRSAKCPCGWGSPVRSSTTQGKDLPELIGRPGRARLVVLGVEVCGRWETQPFLSLPCATKRLHN